jgi:hypothetical protein
MAALEEYVWLVVVGAFVAFGFGFGTGTLTVALGAILMISWGIVHS